MRLGNVDYSKAVGFRAETKGVRVKFVGMIGDFYAHRDEVLSIGWV